MAGSTGNTILTIDMITRMAVKLFRNSNAFMQGINTEYDNQFSREGAKIGDTLRVRLPNDFVVTFGPGASVQNTTEQYTTLPLKTQLHVDTSFSTAEQTLKLDDYLERILAPKINNLAAAASIDLMSYIEAGYSLNYGGSSPAGGGGGICNIVANWQNGPGTAFTNPTLRQWLLAKAILDQNSAPMQGRRVINDPISDANITNTLTGLLNPATQISEQYRSGTMKNAVGFDWASDQNVLRHTVGTFTSGTVNGAGQGGSSPGGTILVTNAITGTLNAGDIITIAGVNAVNRLNKANLGTPRQFVVTAPVASGATSIPIYPGLVAPIIVSGVVTPVQYQTVSASPANGAAISLTTLPGITYIKNFAFCKEFMTMATADLFIPKNLQDSSRQVYDGISMRSLTQYAIGTDLDISRLDIIYGAVVPRGEWGCIVPDLLS